MRFPRIHIATSVQNRILNMADSIAPDASPQPAPLIPDASKTGAAIDAAVTTPPPVMAAPADADAITAAAALEGTSPADALGSEGVLEQL